MTALVRHEDGKNYTYGAELRGDKINGYQWSITLEAVVDEEDNHRIYDVTNRGWQSVGPVFEENTETARFLGFSPGMKTTAKNWDPLIEEYNGLFSDEIETRERFNAENRPKFGRPSQGRTERMQFSASPELRHWLEAQIQPGENVSLVTFRLLEELRKSK